MSVRGAWRRISEATSGATAVEFALVLPAFLAMTLGGLYLATLAFSISSLNFAVQEAARCAAVKTTICTNAITTIAYAAKKYTGPAPAPSFSYLTTGCGHTVTAAATFSLRLLPDLTDVPISASACYPS
ncbi:MAG: hypothetical protein JWQ52_1648 [Phenylobacterium sp.]|nr:hypothetical protein [Phenylobacterium sp.]